MARSEPDWGPESAARPPPTTEPPLAPEAQPRRSRTGPLLLFLLVLAIAVHLVVDNLTPYTSEATMQAPVIGVAPNVSGTIVEIAVEDNQRVAAGELLFVIDPQRFEAAVAQAAATLIDVGQQVGASTAGLGTAEARLIEARARLVDTREQTARTLELVRRGYAPVAQGDTATANLATAEAEVQLAEAALEEARQRLGPTGEDNPQIQAAQAALAQATIDLRDTRVTAPVDGVVTNTVLAVGQFAAAGRHTVTIVDTARGWVMANLKENSLAGIRPGDRAEVVLDSAPGRVLEARVASVAAGVERAVAAGLQGDLAYVPERRKWLREAERIPVRIELLEPEGTAPIRVGARANVVVYTADAGLGAWLGWAWIRFVAFMRFGF